MPLTPLVLRPIGRASDSLKRMAMPLGGGQHDLVAFLGDRHVDHLVVLAQFDGDDSAAHRPAELVASSVFFTNPERGWPSIRIMIGLVEIAHGPAIGHFLAFG